MTSRHDQDLLTRDTVVGYLHARDLVDPEGGVEIAELGGGVSNVVLAVRTRTRSLVVKQARPRLQVGEEWLAEPRRAVTEARAIRFVRELTPDAAPAVVDVDTERFAIVIDHAPTGWTSWKRSLLQGDVDEDVASRLGDLLGTWHAASAGRSDVAEGFDEARVFHQLRVEPYYEATSKRVTDHAPAIRSYAEQMVHNRRCLVHGDLSPKNLLVGTHGLWVIDFEVAHWGDPAFDLAFLLSHLVLKTIHRPASMDAYRRCGQAFVDAYTERWIEAIAWPYVVGHVGCLLLARVEGKSPVEYLDAHERATAIRCAGALLADPGRPEDAWTIVAREVRRDG